MHKIKLVSFELFILLSTLINPVSGKETQLISITDAWISEPPPMLSVLAGYATIHNESSETKMLTAVSSPVFSRIEIHLSKVINGLATMQKQASLAIPAGNTVEFSPGNYHLMLFDPEITLKAGDKATIIFTFSDGYSIPVHASVKKRTINQQNHHHHQ